MERPSFREEPTMPVPFDFHYLLIALEAEKHIPETAASAYGGADDRSFWLVAAAGLLVGWGVLAFGVFA
jgi:hypothetical protein